MYLDMSRHIFGMPIMLSMTPLHSLSYSDKNKMKHDFLSYVIPLVPSLLSYGQVLMFAAVSASHDTNGTVTGIIFVRLR